MLCQTGGKLEIKTNNVLLNKFEGTHYQLSEGNYVRLIITDNGTEMDKATQDKIFDPFFSTKGDKGTGLGMFQVYGLIHKAGGTVHVYSALGHGTRISILLPQYFSNEKISKSQEPLSSDLPQGNEHILIVDDEPSLCQLAADILTLNGYQVETAKGAAAALKKLSENTFDLILSDIIMPEMNDYQLAHKIQKDYPAVKINSQVALMITTALKLLTSCCRKTLFRNLIHPISYSPKYTHCLIHHMI